MVLISTPFSYNVSKYTKRKNLLMRFLRFTYRWLIRCRPGPSNHVLLTLLKDIEYIIIEGA